MTAAITLAYETGTYLLNYIIVESTIEILPFLRITLLEILYNIILVIILYPILQKTGHYLEETFHEKQILTRYF